MRLRSAVRSADSVMLSLTVLRSDLTLLAMYRLRNHLVYDFLKDINNIPQIMQGENILVIGDCNIDILKNNHNSNYAKNNKKMQWQEIYEIMGENNPLSQ